MCNNSRRVGHHEIQAAIPSLRQPRARLRPSRNRNGLGRSLALPESCQAIQFVPLSKQKRSIFVCAANFPQPRTKETRKTDCTGYTSTTPGRLPAGAPENPRFMRRRSTRIIGQNPRHPYHRDNRQNMLPPARTGAGIRWVRSGLLLLCSGRWRPGLVAGGRRRCAQNGAGRHPPHLLPFVRTIRRKRWHRC